MGESTIEWTDFTFNPWRGCSKVANSPACHFCYAEVDRSVRMHGVKWGPKAERRVAADSTWAQPLAWSRRAIREGRRFRVFCASLADVFEARDDLDDHRERLWRLIEQTPHLDWLLLTKRPEDVLRRVPSEWWRDEDVPASWPDNVWIGTTVENQKTADERIPHLLKIPAPVRFLSCEPLLGPVCLTARDGQGAPWCLACRGTGRVYGDENGPNPCVCRYANHRDVGVHWVIAGGESGPKARPSHPDWFRSLRDQCEAAGVPFLFKQHGAWVAWRDRPDGATATVAHRFPSGDYAHRVGKKAAGRLLDGREHNGVPDHPGVPVERQGVLL